MENLAGKSFGRWTVISFAFTRNRKSYWNCRCSCGSEGQCRSDQLKNGDSKSCGCFHSEIIKNSHVNQKHGKSKTRLYNVWCAMKRRCYHKNTPSFKNYGALGVSVCDEWRSYEPFEKWAIENGYRHDARRGETTIDRIDPCGNYSPGNCRIINNKMQSNNRRFNTKLTFENRTMTITEWEEFLGVHRGLVRQRISKLKWPIAKALTQSPKQAK